MSEKATFALRGHNPDVLTCIANLSNDEVFTPPELANQMLDTLSSVWSESHDGANIWADPTVTFLDPFTKSGVFLREIVSRLVSGLEEVIPDRAARVDHILSKQVYGIGITRLTALLARRSVYCSKFANGPHSVAKSFTTADGNIWFQRTEHLWLSGKCYYCRASESEYGRSSDLETHAYAFIHTADIKAWITRTFGADMHFDVIIGNPPYQLKDNGASASAGPIYQDFVQQAMKLDPRYVIMITPSRWFSGGKGLSDFRSAMLNDRHVRTIVDFVLDKDAFPNVNVNGGVNYFLWDRGHQRECSITTVSPGGSRNAPQIRALDEFDIFVRRNEAVSILRNVLAKSESTFDKRVSSRKPFGLPTDYHGSTTKTARNEIKLYGSGRITWVARSDLLVNAHWADSWKVLVSRATDGNENYPLPIWDQRGPFISAPSEASSESYLVASLAANRVEAANIASYMRTKFFRFMVSLRKITQDNKAEIFSFVPDVATDREWSDAELYERYSLTEDEIAFIESQIRDMEFAGD